MDDDTSAADLARQVREGALSIRKAETGIAKLRAGGADATHLAAYRDAKVVEVLEKAIRLSDMTASRPAPDVPPAIDDVAPPTGEPGSAASVREALEAAHVIAVGLRDGNATTPAPRAFLPAVARVCLATAAGALGGAPIGAWVVGESIADEMIMTAIATGFGSAVAEVVTPWSERLGRSPTDEPPSARSTPAIVLRWEEPDRGQLPRLALLARDDPATFPELSDPDLTEPRQPGRQAELDPPDELDERRTRLGDPSEDLDDGPGGL